MCVCVLFIEILVSLDELVYVARWFEDQFTYLNGESDNTVFPSNSNVPSLSLPLFLSVSLRISLSVSLSAYLCVFFYSFRWNTIRWYSD